MVVIFLTLNIQTRTSLFLLVLCYLSRRFDWIVLVVSSCIISTLVVLQLIGFDSWDYQAHLTEWLSKVGQMIDLINRFWLEPWVKPIYFHTDSHSWIQNIRSIFR